MSVEVNGAPVRVPDEWYAGFHTGLVARFWRAAGAAMAADDLRVVRAALGAEPPASVLDVPCGDGRLAVPLAAAGYEVTGVDLAPEEVEEARRAAARAGVDARFAVGDLRALPAAGPVDVVLSWGNAFGYLLPEDTARSLAGMRRALRPGGRLVLESLTVAESLLPGGIAPEAEHRFGDVRMRTVDRYVPEESRLESDVVLEGPGGAVQRTRMAHHVHTAGEVVRMLRAAGFAAVELRGADGAGPYALGSPRLVAIATA